MNSIKTTNKNQNAACGSSDAFSTRPFELLPKYQSLGLKLGMLSIEDIQSWVDARIIESESPSNSLLDLAFSKQEKGFDIHGALLNISDLGDKYEIVRSLLSKVTDIELADLDYCRKLAEVLENFGIDCDYDVPEDLNSIYGFDDEYRLAEQGVYSTIKKWHQDFINFVRGFRENY